MQCHCSGAPCSSTHLTSGSISISVSRCNLENRRTWRRRCAYFTAAAALRPESPGTHFCLGTALQIKGQLDEAIACYRRAIELNQTYVAAYMHHGIAVRKKAEDRSKERGSGCGLTHRTSAGTSGGSP